VAAPHLNAFQAQQVTQHAGASKRMVEVQLVDPAHQGQIAF